MGRQRHGAAMAVGALALSLAAAVSGCGATGDGAGGPNGAGGDVPRIGGGDEVPALPLDRYRMTDEDSERLVRARDRLVQRCMRDLGFTGFPLRPKDPRGSRSGGSPDFALSVVLVSSTPMGSLDLEDARRWGYGWDPERVREQGLGEPDGLAMTQREYQAYHGWSGTAGGRVTVGGRAVPEGGCAGQAGRELRLTDVRSLTTRNYPAERGEAVDQAARKDERVRRAWAQWARCMADKGFTGYSDSREAARDRKWRRDARGNTSHGEREVATAVADVECNRAHNTAGQVWAVLAERQRADLDRNEPRYAAAAKETAALRAKADLVLDGPAK
ncbi:hypothetical protein [Streptomyces sp. NPDC018031]|uniref:hypothetical protein n=1 Tax=Streptomyces sp. NPDC018031 TaxID=3365033 RepID=UPI0037B8A637